MTSHESQEPDTLPGTDLDVSKMPAHWLLARLGKRVLRPGGLGITRALLDGLAIGGEDAVVEFTPGLGGTARMILECGPRSYTGVERDTEAAEWTRRHLPDRSRISVVVGQAERTELADASASVVLGEAMLTMNTQDHKQRIMTEAFRLLRPGGRYGIHELCLFPDNIAPAKRDEVYAGLSSVLHVGARPLPNAEWRGLLETAGFQVRHGGYAPMRLLGPRRLVQDEGVWGALRLVRNVLGNTPARRRVLAMRRAFTRYRDHIGAIFLVGQKPEA